MKIGIFDSGIGGEALKNELVLRLPEASFITVNDKENVPYGDKSPQEIITLTQKAIQPLLKISCDVIVIGCNTATAISIEKLREEYPNQLFIGLDPMIKPAAAITKTGIIAVCATPATLKSERYKLLKSQFANGISIIEPDCSEWAYMIESSQIQKEKIVTAIQEIKEKNIDVIVLACTHYHWIEKLVQELVGNGVSVIKPSDSIADRIRQILKARSDSPPQ